MAGLLSGLMGGGQGGGLLSDPMLRLQMGAQMMQGGSIGDQLGGAFGAAAQYGMQRKQLAEEKAKQNQTFDYIRRQDPELAQAVEAGVIDAPSAYKVLLDRAKPQQPDYGNTPIPMYDENGNYTIGQLGSDNTANPVKLPKGWRVGDPYEKAFQGASGAAAGKDQGETVATYESVMSKMPGLEKVVTELNGLADQATYTMGGNIWNETLKQTGFGPSAGAVARTKYMSMVDNQVLPLLKDTFGAAFTVTEGESLRATLGDPNKTPEEKKMVLEAFIEQKRRDANALAARTGNAPYQPAAGSLAQPQAGAVGGASIEELLQKY